MVSKAVIAIGVGAAIVLALGLGLGLGLSGDSTDPTEAPTDAPTTKPPVTDSTEAPTTDAPVTDSTEAPTTDAPVTDAPTTTPMDSMIPFTLQNYIDGTYRGKSVAPNWVGSEYQSDDASDLYYQDGPDGQIQVFNLKTNELIAEYTVPESSMDSPYFSYMFSNTGSHAFFAYDFKKLWRTTSYNATYKLYDADAQQWVESIFDMEDFTTYCPSGNTNIQVLQWAPKGIAGVFVCEFNVFYFTNPTDFSTITQVTFDGRDNEVYNGIPEWVYEEEMLGSNNALYWSPDATKLMYVKFVTQTVADKVDDRDAHIYKYSWYGHEQYPETKEISYAKAGTTPSSNEIFVFDTTKPTQASQSLKSLQAFTDPAEDNYFSRAGWLDEQNMVIIWTNRVQNVSQGHFFKETGGSWGLLATEPTQPSDAAKYSEENGWVGSFGPWWPKYFVEGSYFTIRSKKVDAEEGFWTVARVEAGTDTPIFLADHSAVSPTKGYTDTDLAHYDSATDSLYYYAAAPAARHRQIHMVSPASQISAPVAPVCVSCQLIDKYRVDNDAAKETRCGWIDAIFHGDNVIFNCRGGAGVPITVWKSLGDLPDTTKEFAVLENNDELSESLKNVKMPQKEYGTYQSDTYSFKENNFQWFKPSDFDATKKYPLVIEVYAGPEFQKVTDTWSPDFCQSMVSEYDILCASVDGRGSAFEGDKFMQQIYLKLGQYEPVDQTDFGKYMASLEFVDESKIAIWGWSYGGYTTTHTISYGNDGANDVFACGVAVAPLASWRYYDIMYAERYLRTPAENEDGYDRAEVWYNSEKPGGPNEGFQGFKDAWYTVIAGTADDNVHFMSAAHIEKKLVDADVDFDNFYYADEDHSIRSTPEVNYHVYQNIRRHLLNHRCLNVL